MYYDRRSSNLRKLSAKAQSVIAGMLEMDPSRRLTVAQVLSHPFFDAVREEVSTISLQRLRDTVAAGTSGAATTCATTTAAAATAAATSADSGTAGK